MLKLFDANWWGVEQLAGLCDLVLALFEHH